MEVTQNPTMVSTMNNQQQNRRLKKGQQPKSLDSLKCILP